MERLNRTFYNEIDRRPPSLAGPGSRWPASVRYRRRRGPDRVGRREKVERSFKRRK